MVTQTTQDNAIAAGLWGLLSAFSLLLGAVFGVSCTINHKLNGLLMAFGAGALFFAVAIEMFAAGLRELEEGADDSHMNTLVGMAIVGALFFTFMNRCLSGGGEAGSEHGHEHDDYDKVRSGDSEELPSTAGTQNKAEHSGVAFTIWLGILIDGVPEAMLIGFMQAEGELSVAFIVAVFIANFPEAMSAASIMRRNGDSTCKIICMWNILFLGTGLVACLTCLAFPKRCVTEVQAESKGLVHDPQRGHGVLVAGEGSGGREYEVCEFTAAVNFLAVASEGLAGGAMMACIATAMLPEAYEEGGDFSGLATLLGFLASLFVKLSFEEKGGHGTVCAVECPSIEGHAHGGATEPLRRALALWRA